MDDPGWLWLMAAGMTVDDWMEFNPCNCEAGCACPGTN